MSADDLLFETTAAPPPGPDIYPPLDLDLVAYGGPPVEVKVTNFGTTDLADLVLFIRPATGMGDYTLATDDPPETDYQKAVSWGESTEAAVSTAGGIRINFPVEDAAISGAVSDSAGSPVDETADINDVGANDVIVFTNVTTANEYLYIGMPYRFSELSIDVGTAGVGGTATWEYYDTGAAWSALAGVTDDTTGFTVLGEESVSFTVPNDWDATAVAPVVGDLFWIRAKCDAGYTTVPIVTSAVCVRYERYVTWSAGSQKSNGFPVKDIAASGSWVFQLEVETPAPAVGAERVFFDVVIE